jgi:NAD(P)-dependent dehydrogenase (short-subunit alcohol dehydrogenase family)
VKASLPHLSAGASITVTGSDIGFEGPELLSDYAVSKGAIHTLIKVLAKQLANRGHA